MAKLKVAYAGHDFFSSCLLEIVNNPSCELVALLTEPPGGSPADEVRRIARTTNADIFTNRPDPTTIQALNSIGVDLLICAAYKHKMPVDEISAGLCVNIHPSLLPYGRGSNPLPYFVAGHSQNCGVTIHEMTMTLDRGPIIIQERVELDVNDGLDECYLKIFSTAPRLLRRLISEMNADSLRKDELLLEGSYWPEKDWTQRTILAESAKIDEVKRLAFEFGMLGVRVELADKRQFAGNRISAVSCSHLYSPGELIAQTRLGSVISVTDGLIGLGTTQAAEASS